MLNLVIQCQRLKITMFTESMAQVVHENSLDKNNRRFMSDEVYDTIEEAREAIKFLITCYGGNDGPLVYPIILTTGENIGYVQLARLSSGEWEVGYHIAEPFTGNGYATEALTAFLPIILPSLSLSKVWGICNGDNIASCKVLEKSSFTLQSKDIGNYKGEMCTVCKYLYTHGD